MCELFSAASTIASGRKVGVERVHLGPVHHDVGHGQLAKIEHASQHVAGQLHHAAFLVVQLDRAPDLFVRREHLGVVADGDAEQAQGVADEELHGARHRREHRHHEIDDRRDGKSHAVGVEDGVGLGQHLGEQHHDHRHHHGGVGHALLAEQGQEQAGGERRSSDIGKRVAEQDGADEALADGEQIIHHPGTRVAVALERVHLGGRGPGERRLGA